MVFINERLFKGQNPEVTGLNGNNKTNGSESTRNELSSVQIMLEILKLNNLNTCFKKEFQIYHMQRTFAVFYV